MIRILIVLALFIFVFIHNSCIIVNQTNHLAEEDEHKTPEICIVHNAKMKKKVVGVQYGPYYDSGNTSDYPNAKRKAPIGCSKLTWPNQRLAIIFICDSCNMIKSRMK